MDIHPFSETLAFMPFGCAWIYYTSAGAGVEEENLEEQNRQGKIGSPLFTEIAVIGQPGKLPITVAYSAPFIEVGFSK
jgi:hypothetical protein